MCNLPQGKKKCLAQCLVYSKDPVKVSPDYHHYFWRLSSYSALGFQTWLVWLRWESELQSTKHRTYFPCHPSVAPMLGSL